ncbi:hypothetical protein [Runella sp.]|jgi:hypothetical protein|uniref:hypothetical protein n=1 Tax=Runella sp. TaxID=1960881 RepID=UPI0026397FC9|nr:hypothetical protein [Runella sp.]
MNQIIKDFYNKIRVAEEAEVKQKLIAELKIHINGLSVEEQKRYRETVIASIESKFEVMDKLVDAYQALKNDYIQFAS